MCLHGENPDCDSDPDLDRNPLTLCNVLQNRRYYAHGNTLPQQNLRRCLRLVISVPQPDALWDALGNPHSVVIGYQRRRRRRLHNRNPLGNAHWHALAYAHYL